MQFKSTAHVNPAAVFGHTHECEVSGVIRFNPSTGASNVVCLCGRPLAAVEFEYADAGLAAERDVPVGSLVGGLLVCRHTSCPFDEHVLDLMSWYEEDYEIVYG